MGQLGQLLDVPAPAGADYCHGRKQSQSWALSRSLGRQGRAQEGACRHAVRDLVTLSSKYLVIILVLCCSLSQIYMFNKSDISNKIIGEAPTVDKIEVLADHPSATSVPSILRQFEDRKEGADLFASLFNKSDTSNKIIGEAPTVDKIEVLADHPSATSVPSILRQFEDRKEGADLFASLPVLVVCRSVDSAIAHMFMNFTVVRLNENETPPPWNATVFLHGNKCADHPYVVESMERRKQAPFLVASNLSSFKSMQNKPSIWVNGVRWQDFSAGSTKYLRVIRDRPAIIKILGEVFWRMHYEKMSCSDVDFIVYREVETPIQDCLTIHYLQGVTTTMSRGAEGKFGLHNTADILENVVPHPHKPAGRVDYERFCSFLVKFNSTHPTEMFKSPLYDIDAIVRHMFFLQLGEYKPCERITNCSESSPYTAFHCMVGYKFHITMDNTLVDGYVSEKLFNGALAGGIPIYFGASDVANYVNKKSFIHCNISREVIEEMRSFYPRGAKPRPFLFTNSSLSTDKELLSWADKYLRPQLDPCVRKVIQLDRNDEDYMMALNQPFILNRDIMSGAYPMRGVELAYNLLSSSNKNDKGFVIVPDKGVRKKT